MTPGCLKKLLKTRNMASHGHRKVCVFNLNPNIWFSRKIQICKLHLVLCVANCVATTSALAAALCYSRQHTSYHTSAAQVVTQCNFFLHWCSSQCNLPLIATLVQKKAALCCSSGCTSVAASALPAATQCSYCIGWCNTMQQLLHWLLQHSAAANALPTALCCSRYPRG